MKKVIMALLAAAAICIGYNFFFADKTGRVQSISINDIPDEIGIGLAVQADVSYDFAGTVPENAEETTSKIKLTFSSSNPQVLDVTKTGLMTGIAEGSAEVSVTDFFGMLKASKTVKVMTMPTDISMLKTVTLNISQAKRLTPTFSPENAAEVKLQFKSDNPEVASVNADGVIQAKEGGMATITAYSDEVGISAKCDVTVIPDVKALYISDQSVLLEPNDNVRITYEAEPSNAVTDKTIPKWESSDESVATVDSRGSVTAISDGVAYITVRIGNITSDRCTVYVKSKKIEVPEQTPEPESTLGELPYAPPEGEGWVLLDSSSDAFQVVVTKINAIRINAGLNRLDVDESLNSVAQERCQVAYTTNTLINDGAQYAELLSSDSDNALTVCESWRDSQDSYNVLTGDSYTRMGIACLYTQGNRIWCVVFG